MYRYLIWIGMRVSRKGFSICWKELLLSGSDQEKTFGPTISGLIQKNMDPDRVCLWDTKKRGGRPDTMKLLKEIYVSWNAEGKSFWQEVPDQSWMILSGVHYLKLYRKHWDYAGLQGHWDPRIWNIMGFRKFCCFVIVTVICGRAENFVFCFQWPIFFCPAPPPHDHGHIAHKFSRNCLYW